MLEPKRPELRLLRCLTQSTAAWASNLPALFLATFLLIIPSVLLFPLVIAATLTGLTRLMLDAIEGRPVRIRNGFTPFKNPIRFVVISTGSIVCYVTWFLILLVLVVAILPPAVLPSVISQDIDPVRQAIAQLVSPEVIAWLPAYQPPPYGWSVAVVLLTFLILVIEVEIAILVIRSFYVPLIVSDRSIPIVDAYVESRNTVRRFGYLRHLVLIAASSGLAVAPSVFLTDGATSGIASLLFLPLAVGLIASAYTQTVGVEQANLALRERQFVEMRDELQTAHDMQMDLLPDQPPELPDYSLDGISVPANNVGGDYFSYRWLDDGKTRLAIVVADVSGKAMHAAVTALRFSEILRYECRGRTKPGPILDGLTRAIDEQTDDATFVTCCIAVLHVESGRVEVANAGHCYPYRIAGRQAGAEQIDINGLPLGLPALIRPDDPYPSVTVDLEPGDGLLLYSDGVVEAQDVSGEMYDEGRLETVIRSTAPVVDARRTVRTIYGSVDAFTGDASRTDDITVVALRRQHGGSPESGPN